MKNDLNKSIIHIINHRGSSDDESLHCMWICTNDEERYRNSGKPNR